MKFKFAIIFITVVVLFLLKPFWYIENSYVIKVVADKPKTDILMEYSGIDKQSMIIKQTIGNNGKTEFRIVDSDLKMFNLKPEKDVKIESVVIKGKKKSQLEVTKNLTFEDINLKGKINVDFSFILLVFLSVTGIFLFLKDVRWWKKDIASARLPSFLNIEFLRIFFTLGVVCSHFFECIHLWNGGGRGVEFFFILSGYLFAWTWRSDRNIGDFMKQKFIRFVPLTVFGGLMCGGELSVLSNLFFLQNTGLWLQGPVNGPAWYIGVLFWVLLFYFMAFRVLDGDKLKWFIGFTVFCSFVTYIGAGSFGDRPNFAISYFPSRLIRGLGCVGLGCLLAQVCSRSEKTVYCGKKYSLFEILFTAFALLSIFVKMDIMAEEWIMRPIVFSGLIYLFIRREGFLSSFLEKPFFAFLAQYCLAVYLTQWIVIQYFRNLSEQYNEIFLSHRFVVICSVLAVSWFVGVAAHYIIERPVANYLKKQWFQQHKPLIR